MAVEGHIEQDVVRAILDLEWEMFHDVRGLDGPAPCQQDRTTFEIMRSSQLLVVEPRDRRELPGRSSSAPGRPAAIS